MKLVAAAVIVVAIALAGCSGCKDKRDEPKPTPTEGHPVVPDAGIDDRACTDAIAAAAAAPTYMRAASLVHCTVCGDWRPILDWNVMSSDGGPARLEVDHALESCNATCDRAAMKKMASALDKARGGDSRGPWRLLGESCGDKVSSVPDARNMTAPYFALDRIARAIGARGGDLAKQLASLDIAIPAVTISGVGPTLAEGIATVHPAGPDEITLLGPEVRIGVLPHATLGARGVTVTGDFPGAVSHKLRDDIDKLGDRPIALLAPVELPAAKIAALLLDASRLASEDPRTPPTHAIELAVAAPGAPRGWQVPATIPIAINASPMAMDTRLVEMAGGVVTRDTGTPSDRRPTFVVVDDKTTVGELAKELDKLAGEGLRVGRRHDDTPSTLTRAASSTIVGA